MLSGTGRWLSDAAMKRVLLLLLLLVPAAAGAQVCDVYNIENAGDTPAFSVRNLLLEPQVAAPYTPVRASLEVEFRKSGNVSITFLRRAGEEQVYRGGAEPGRVLSFGIPFSAPPKPGTYRAVFRINHEAEDGCTLAYLTATLRVVKAKPAPEVVLTSPADGAVVVVGREVMIDGVVPPGSNITVKANGTVLGHSLPLLWKPERAGVYTITLNVSLWGSRPGHSIRVLAVNTSGVSWLSLPEPVLRLHAAGTSIVAVTERNVYLVESSGRAVKLANFSTTPESVTHSSMILLAHDSTLYLFNGSHLVWKKRVVVQPERIAVSHSGVVVLGMGKLYLHDTRGMLLKVVELGSKPEMLAAGDELIATASGDSVAAYAYTGRLLWNTSLYERVYDVEVLGSEVLVLLPGRVVSIANGTPEELLSFAWKAEHMSAGRKGIVLSSPSEARMYTRDGRLAGWLRSGMGIGGGVVDAAGRGVVLVAGRLAVLSPPEKQPVEIPLLPIALALGIAAISGAGVLIWKRQRQKRRREMVKLRTARVAKSIKLESTAAVDSTTDRLKREVEGAYHRVRELDPCLPAYFRGVALQVAEAVHSADDISLRHSLSRAAEIAVPLLCDAMEDWKNMEVYSSEPASSECSPPAFRIRGKLTGEEVERRLAEVDREIANALGYLSTAPPASLWRVAMKVAKAAESEKARQGYYEVAAYLLDCVEHMLSEGELSRRLRR